MKQSGEKIIVLMCITREFSLSLKISINDNCFEPTTESCSALNFQPRLFISMALKEFAQDENAYKHLMKIISNCYIAFIWNVLLLLLYTLPNEIVIHFSFNSRNEDFMHAITVGFANKRNETVVLELTKIALTAP